MLYLQLDVFSEASAGAITSWSFLFRPSRILWLRSWFGPGAGGRCSRWSSLSRLGFLFLSFFFLFAAVFRWHHAAYSAGPMYSSRLLFSRAARSCACRFSSRCCFFRSSVSDSSSQSCDKRLSATNSYPDLMSCFPACSSHLLPGDAEAPISRYQSVLIVI